MPTLCKALTRYEELLRPQLRALRRRRTAASCGRSAQRSSLTKGKAAGESSHSVTGSERRASGGAGPKSGTASAGAAGTSGSED